MPNQTILVVVGDLTQEQASALDAGISVHGRKDALARPTQKPSPLDRKMVQLIEKDLTQSTIVLGHATVSRISPDYYAITVAELYSGRRRILLAPDGFYSRQTRPGLRHHASQFDSRVMPGAFFINLQTRTDVTNQAITVCWRRSRRSAKPRSRIRSSAKRNPSSSAAFRCASIRAPSWPTSLAQVELYNLGLDYFYELS